ncbi:MAG: hypothetical protein SOW51_02765, partial [Oscillospiraceae bacterium]|nr:hypothetical protein [Oscillospiraceae bacterium]
MKKKFFSLVLAVLMIMSALPMGAFAVQDLPKSMYTYADDLSEEENDNKPVEKIKIKFVNPIISLGTPLSSAIEVYVLNSNSEWEKVTGYSASGYKADQAGAQTVKIKYGEYAVNSTVCVSSQSEQYINFSDSGLFEKLIDSGTDKNGDGMISVTEMESLNGAFGFDGVSDVSGLEYAGPDLKLSGDGWTAPVKDVFALQSYRSMEMLENARRNIDIYSRIAMKDYREDISYSSSDPEIAKVSKEEYKDVICTGKAGVATITAFCAGLSKSFEVTVVSADKPMGEKTNNIPELLTKDSYNADGSFYIGNQRVRFDSKVLMSTFYPARNYYYGTYYLTEDGNLWTLNEGARFPRKIGTDFAKITTFDDYSGSGLALDKNGNCWELNDFELIATDVKDINGMFFLTKDNELYRCYDTVSNQVGDDLFKNVLVSSDVISIVKTRTYGECIYNKKDGTYYVATGSHYFSPDYKPIKICSGKFAKDVLSYYSSYFYIDENSVLWEITSEGTTEKVADNIERFNLELGGFLSKNGSLYMLGNVTRSNGKYDLGSPVLTNVKKNSDRFYLDKDNNLYASIYGAIYTLCWGIREGEKPVKIMTNVVDFTECPDCVIFTRTDGSVWTWKMKRNEDYYEKILEASSARDKILTDAKTGIKIEFKNRPDKNLKLEVSEASDANSLKLVNMSFGEVKAKMFDVSIKKGNAAVQPDGSVTVSIPVPDNFDRFAISVCSLDTSDGTAVK